MNKQCSKCVYSSHRDGLTIKHDLIRACGKCANTKSISKNELCIDCLHETSQNGNTRLVVSCEKHKNKA